jgi:lipoprotein-releasing system ATP-binding protein
MDPDAEVAIRARGLSKSYLSGAERIQVLENLDFEIPAGEMAALTGESGAGKTTLLLLLGGLERPTSGSIEYGSTDITSLEVDRLAHFRNRTMGFVWQQSSLLPEFTAAENVSMPLRIRGCNGEEAQSRAMELLAEMGLASRARHRSGELSGGEKQRVALARALVGNPSVLLADEPTGSLDQRTGERIMDLLEEVHARHRLTSVLVTHNPEFAARCNRTFVLQSGRIDGRKMKGRSYV